MKKAACKLALFALPAAPLMVQIAQKLLKDRRSGFLRSRESKRGALAAVSINRYVSAEGASFYPSYRRRWMAPGNTAAHPCAALVAGLHSRNLTLRDTR